MVHRLHCELPAPAHRNSAHLYSSLEQNSTVLRHCAMWPAMPAAGPFRAEGRCGTAWAKAPPDVLRGEGAGWQVCGVCKDTACHAPTQWGSPPQTVCKGNAWACKWPTHLCECWLWKSRRAGVTIRCLPGLGCCPTTYAHVDPWSATATGLDTTRANLTRVPPIVSRLQPVPAGTLL